MNRKTTTVLAFLCTLLAVSLVASADFMTYEGMGYNCEVTIYAPFTAIHNTRVMAGEQLISYHGQDYSAWCVDINHWVGSGEVLERDVTSLRNGHLVAYLCETFAASVDSNTSAAALNLALWEVINETQLDWFYRPIFNITRGNFSVYASGNVLEEAQAMLDSMPIMYAPTTDLLVLHSSCMQDVLVSVPEASTLSLLGLGGAFFLRRRRW